MDFKIPKKWNFKTQSKNTIKYSKIRHLNKKIMLPLNLRLKINKIK